MISEATIATVTGISRNFLREFRARYGQKKEWFAEEAGAITWTRKPLALLEAEAGMQRGEIETHFDALEKKEAQAGTHPTATVIRLCLNPRIVLGTIAGIEGACRIKIPNGRRVRPGVRLYVKEIGDHFYSYAGRVHE